MARISNLRAKPTISAVNESVMLYWLFALMLYWLFALMYLVLIGMGRSKGKGKRSQIVEEESEEEEEYDEMDEDDEMEEDENEEEEGDEHDAYQAWVDSVDERRFACERQFDIAGVIHPAIEVIEKQNLGFWFLELDGFRESLVRVFYINMEVVDNDNIGDLRKEVNAVQESNSRLKASNKKLEKLMRHQAKHNAQQQRWTKHLLERLPEEDQYPFTDEEDLGGGD